MTASGAGRIVSWYSHGACSAIATKMALAKYGPDLVIATIVLDAEHADQSRFRADCERWYDHEIVTLRSAKYVDTWDVWKRTRYLVGPAGARCTGELKKAVRYAFEQPDDLQIYGYAADTNDAKRAVRFVEQNPGVDAEFPLIERNITKAECLTLLNRAGIELPAMYRLGYSNNNCIGCVKGGMGYWNKIRVDFPDVFDRMALLERELGHTCLRSKGEAVYLDELDSERGNYKAETSDGCSIDCETVEVELATSVCEPSS